MNKAGFVGMAVLTPALFCLSACADMDKLSGKQANDYIPSPEALQANAQSSADSSSADTRNGEAATDKSARR